MATVMENIKPEATPLGWDTKLWIVWRTARLRKMLCLWCGVRIADIASVMHMVFGASMTMNTV
jgi:hypothetical protein